MKFLQFLAYNLIVLILMSAPDLVAQSGDRPESRESGAKEKSPIRWIDAKDVKVITESGERTHYLKGNVELRQDTMYFFSDSAVLKQNLLYATGNVVILQGDSIAIFGDTLNYNGNTRYGYLTGECFIEQKKGVLFSNFLEYDAHLNKAYYNRGALLTDGEFQLTSKQGIFNLNTSQMLFRDSVEIIGDDFLLKSDSLLYDLNLSRAYFIAPTLIKEGDASIYAEGGHYDLETGDAVFYKNPQYQTEEELCLADTMTFDGPNNLLHLKQNVFYQKDSLIIRAHSLLYDLDTEIVTITDNALVEEGKRRIQSDTIIYDLNLDKFYTRGRAKVSEEKFELEADSIYYGEEQGIGHAYGEVEWHDLESGMKLYSEQAIFQDSSSVIKAFGNRPLMSYPSDTDTMYLAADTIFSFTQMMQTDTHRLTLAYYDVRIFSREMQAVCDSLSHMENDSLFRMMYQPMIWMDTTQLTGDTIDVQLSEGKISGAFIRKNAMVLTSPDSIHFNQIKGREIRVTFREGSLRKVRTYGNAEALYFAMDEEDAYIGVNKSESSEISLIFEESELESIKFYGNFTSNLTPMDMATRQSFRLKGFNWNVDRRPRSVRDLRGLQKGGELPVDQILGRKE
nr:hypothetical protein [Saprospiraceae bacterium]